MSERGFSRPTPGLPPGAPRGPLAPHPAPATTWLDGDPPVLAEHRGGLADAEADAAYRWAAAAAAGRHVLDVGCGAGHGAPILLDAGAASVLGTDEDARITEMATRLYGTQARFITAIPQALPLSDRSFDLVCCFEALEASTDPDSILAALRRVLTDDGLLLVSLPLEPVLDPISGRELTSRREVAEWRRLLSMSFTSVDIYRRRASFAATIVAEGADSEPARAAWLGAEPGEERAVLAVATNGEAPDLAAVSSLIGTRDLRAYRDTIAAWEQRARRAEADGSAKHWELVASREAQRRLRKRLWDLEHTPIRKLLRVLTGRPAKLGEGPPIRPPELDPEPWD